MAQPPSDSDSYNDSHYKDYLQKFNEFNSLQQSRRTKQSAKDRSPSPFMPLGQLSP
jgi:hypothetical protein